jgi:hypothetical protein
VQTYGWVGGRQTHCCPDWPLPGGFNRSDNPMSEFTRNLRSTVLVHINGLSSRLQLRPLITNSTQHPGTRESSCLHHCCPSHTYNTHSRIASSACVHPTTHNFSIATHSLVVTPFTTIKHSLVVTYSSPQQTTAVDIHPNTHTQRHNVSRCVRCCHRTRRSHHRRAQSHGKPARYIQHSLVVARAPDKNNSPLPHNTAALL